jgi:hypothetical protein
VKVNDIERSPPGRLQRGEESVRSRVKMFGVDARTIDEPDTIVCKPIGIFSQPVDPGNRFIFRLETIAAEYGYLVSPGGKPG